MNLILLGAPGAGKGTQAELLTKALSIPAISTGNMLREAMANGSELGQKIKKSMDEGSLVSDDVIISILCERISQPDCENGFILDGVPRTLSQAKTIDEKGIKIDHVISLEVNDEAIIDRMSGRRVCTACGASYHLVNNPPKNDRVCDRCGAAVGCRKDDAPETVRHRLEVYHEATEIVKDYYAEQNKLCLIGGNQEIADIYCDILKAIGEDV